MQLLLINLGEALSCFHKMAYVKAGHPFCQVEEGSLLFQRNNVNDFQMGQGAGKGAPDKGEWNVMV